jgi:hypothetical protein
VRHVVGARQRVAFAVRPIESARQIIWRTAKAVFPAVVVSSGLRGSTGDGILEHCH